MEMNNKEIRMLIFMYNLKKKDVAKHLNIADYEFSHWLQDEMPEKKKTKVLQAIKEMTL